MMASSGRHLNKMAQSRVLSITPSTSMIDQQVAIKATGMKANSLVTIRSVVEKKTRRGSDIFESHAHYKVDNKGEVSVSHQASLSGQYNGIGPMGLFWSMVPSPGVRFGARYIQRDATKPMVVQLSLYEGQLDTAALQTKEPEATAAAERWYMGKDVERIEVESGRLRGALFKPKGPGPFPGVIDMFGIAGGLIEIRAAMLASHGFACYALPYINYKDLPRDLWMLEAEYFRVNAAVSINGSHTSTFPLTLNGVVIPYIPCHYAKKNMERLKRYGCTNYQLLSYPDAGHLLEIPWAPVGSRFWSPSFDGVVEHGGTPIGNIRAMEDSWPKILSFLRSHCGHGNSKL